MRSESLSLVLAASLAAATPLRRQTTAYPPISTATAFTLVANITDTSSTVFDPPIGSWSMVGVHVGAGLNAAVLDPTLAATFFVNGTAMQISSQGTSVALPPLGDDTNPIPQGMTFGLNGDEVAISLSTGLGATGAGIVGGLRSPWPELFTHYTGTFVVCNVTDATYGNPQYQVRIEEADVPANCVPITLLAQCATLPELVGVEELNIIVEPVPCYENVAAIDWSQY
jgi:hypothetical protein